MRNYRKPYKAKKKKSILKNRFLWLGILILAIFSGIFYLICFHSFFQIKVIEISGNEKVSTGSLENLLNKKISQKFLFLPSQSIFLTHFNEIKKEILRDFPQVSETELKRKLPHTLLLQIKEREPVALFCQVDKMFFVDKEGIIFESLDPNMTKQDFSTLKKEADGEINLGEKIIEEEQLAKILEVESKLKNQLRILTEEERFSFSTFVDTLVIEEILVVSEIRFDVKTSEGFKIYFNFKEDLDWQLTKLRAVLEEEVPPGKRKDLEYIDVRFGKFAPYVYRD
ncbi:MAG TPA: FtsQ-type POTRA domain-containing protein [Candidatus Humimicrobiaceae bacterium]|nr:FtsQ-type POTRA domain-containing protein [Candidatus Humimicrobiaceae bacterium]